MFIQKKLFEVTVCCYNCLMLSIYKFYKPSPRTYRTAKPLSIIELTNSRSK